MLHHYLNTVHLLTQNYTVTRTQVLTLTDLPVVPTHSQPISPTLNYNPLHLLPQIFPDTPQTHIGDLFLRIHSHLNMIVTKILTVRKLLNSRHPLDQSYLPKETVTTRLRNQQFPHQSIVYLEFLSYSLQLSDLLFNHLQTLQTIDL